MMLTRLSAFALACALMGTAFPARAQRDIGPQEADRRFNEGKELFKQRHFAEARVKMLEACAAHHTHNCAKNLGVTEYELGLFADAATHLEEYLTEDGSRADAQLPRIRAMLEESLAKSGHVVVDAPAGATIAVDDHVVGNAPLPGTLHVAPGTHSVRASWIGGNIVVATIRAEAGKATKAVLVAAGPTAPAVSAASSVDPSSAPLVPSGPSQSARPAERPVESLWATRHYVGVVVTGVGVVSLATGGYFGAKSHDDADRAATAGGGLGPSACTSSSNARCSDVKGARDSQSRDNTLSAVLIGAGLASIAVGAALVLWPRSKALAITVTPTVSVSGGALDLRGTF